MVVKVLDESDQPPEFEKSSYRKDIDENEKVVSDDVMFIWFEWQQAGYRTVGTWNESRRPCPHDTGLQSEQVKFCKE